MTAAVPLPPRTLVALAVTGVVGLLIFLWPLTLTVPTTEVAHIPVVLGVVLLLVLAVLLVAISDGGIDVKAVALLGLLAAVGAILRPLAAGTAGIETVFLPLVLGGRVLGPGFGFVLGSTTLFSSALLTGGVGPWLPYQMLAAGFVGLGAGLLPKAGRKLELVWLCAWGALSAFVFGWLMDLAFWPFTLGTGTDASYVPGAPALENLHRFVVFNALTSLGWNIGRVATNVIGIALLATPMLRVLRRTTRKARFVAAERELTVG